MNVAYLPSLSQGVWHLGPLPIRAYALCILAGIFTAVWLTGRRWEAWGGRREDIADIAIWAVPSPPAARTRRRRSSTWS